ncbi:MAG: hypothetical protein RL708_1926 [Bacteroidota bacterium]
MKHFYKIFFVLLIAFTPVFAKVHVPAKPLPEHLVNDFANLLSANESHLLEQKLEAYSDSTSNQIVIVIVESLNDDEPIDVALGILREWGVGQKKKNNGVVVLVAPNQHKISIATGYGLEGVLPDGVCKLIIENEIKPYFKANQYYQGLDYGLDAIFKASKGEYTTDDSDFKKTKKGTPTIFIILIIVIILIIIVSRFNGGGGSMINGGGFAGPIIFGGGGFGGGNSSWGDSGGGGGFGGFGGGSGGGGGASGSW